MPLLFLLLAILMLGVEGAGLKPADSYCRNQSELQLFNGCFTLVATIGAAISALAVKGTLVIPPFAMLTAFCFGAGFSICVFYNLKALHVGPVSITTLIVNFSLVMPLIYSFCWLGEAVTPLRIIGILLIIICMLIFANPRLIGEEKISAKWLLLAVISMLANGTITLITKIFSMKTDNAYAEPYLFWCYLSATVVSVIIAFVTNIHREGDDAINLKRFFTPKLIGIAALCGATNFMLNYMVTLLTTLMDGAIVYPAVQGGGPVITTVISVLLFGEKLTWKKSLAILLGVIAIVLLNL